MEYMFFKGNRWLLPPIVLYCKKKGTKRFHNTKSRDQKGLKENIKDYTYGSCHKSIGG
jgi:hypothetical protein